MKGGCDGRTILENIFLPNNFFSFHPFRRSMNERFAGEWGRVWSLVYEQDPRMPHFDTECVFVAISVA